jgi:hypothetical protein
VGVCAKNKRNTAWKNTPAKIHGVKNTGNTPSPEIHPKIHPPVWEIHAFFFFELQRTCIMHTAGSGSGGEVKKTGDGGGGRYGVRWGNFFFNFDLFNAAWWMWTPQPRWGTQLQLSCSVVSLLRALLAPRIEPQSRLAPLCPVRFLPSPLLGLAFWLPQSRILAAVLGPCEPLGGKGIAGPFPGFDFKSSRRTTSAESEIDQFQHMTQDRRVRSPGARSLSLGSCFLRSSYGRRWP